MKARFFLVLAFALSLIIGGMSGTKVRAATPSPGVADAVWGQADFFSHVCRRASTVSLCGPSQVTVDAQGNLWVVDYVNNRILMYRPGRSSAAKVFGQYGSFTTRRCDQRPPKASHYPAAPNRYTLCEPFGVAVDSAGTLYIADSINNRVLVYFHAAEKPSDAPADAVLGQANFTSTASNDVPRGGHGALHCPAPRPASRCTLNSPMELSLDSQGDLIVPDVDNNRVLLWSRSTLARLRPRTCVRRCFIPASRVWGQYGSFATDVGNNPAIPSGASSRCTRITVVTPASACTLFNPSAAMADADGNLFVADTSNNRVLEYDHALSTSRQDATTVYGQSQDFTTALIDAGGVSADSLWNPIGLVLGPENHLWVSDFRNMRVLEFPPPGSSGATTAIHVLGQQGSFATNGCAVRADTLCGPTSISFDPAGHAFVTDGLNNRMLEFVVP